MQASDPFSSSVGAFVLDTLTVGMYTDARDAVREYIQNSLDGIRHAANDGLISNDDGKITVRLAPALDQLIISDNGAGINHANAAATLLSIGKSSKTIGENAGFRGIGRLAGIAYCDALIFETSHVGEEVGTRIEFNCAELRSNFDPNKPGPTKDLEAVMRNSCQISEFEQKKDAHFFRVTMKKLKGDGRQFLGFEYLHQYLCQYAPVDYNAQKLMWASAIRKRIETGTFNVPTTRIDLLGDDKRHHTVLKPYKGRYRIHGGATLEITGIEFFDDPTGEGRYWGWYSKSELLGSITEKECAGLRIRVENILVGGSQLTELLFATDSPSNARFNNYFVGEIFLRPGLVVPNARRDGFEDTETWRSVRTELEDLARELSTQVRSSSQDRNKSVAKIKTEVERLISHTDDQIDQGFTSEEDRNNQVTKIERQLHRVDTALTRGRSKEETSQIKALKAKLDRKKEEVSKVKRFAVTSLQGVLNKRQMAVLRSVFEVLKNELDEQTYSAVKGKIEQNLRQSKKNG